MNDRGLDAGLILFQDIQQVVAFPGTTRDQIDHQGNIGAGEQVEADRTIATIADMLLRKQILLVEFPLGTIDRGMAQRSPGLRQRTALIRSDKALDGGVQLLFGNMILIDPADLPAIEGAQSRGGGTRADRTAVAKYRRQIGFNRVLQLAFKAGERAEAFRPVQPMFGIRQCIQDTARLLLLGQRPLEVVQAWWIRLSPQPAEKRPALDDVHLRIGRKGLVGGFREGREPLLQCRNEGIGTHGEAELLAIVANVCAIGFPGTELRERIAEAIGPNDVEIAVGEGREHVRNHAGLKVPPIDARRRYVATWQIRDQAPPANGNP